MEYDDIIQKCKKQQRKAQLAFYQLFAREAYASSYRLLNDMGEAEEVMQDVLLKALSRVELLLDDRADMQRRLCRMAVNAAVDRLRKRKVHWVEWNDAVEPEAEEVYDEVNWRDIQFERMEQAIARLPEGYRTVLSLHVMEGMGFDEIASMLHVAPSTVRSQLSRAKNRLIQWLYGKG